MGEKEAQVLSSGVIIAHAVKGLFSMAWKRAPPVTAFLIKPEWLQQQKSGHSNAQELAAAEAEKARKEAEESVPFVSTNDIVTSWFFQHINASFGLMALNFRNHLPGITDSDAGNYESAITSSESDLLKKG